MNEVCKPMMKDDQLLECLRRFCPGISVTADDLKSPKPTFIISVLQQFLVAMQVNMDYVYTPPFSTTMESIENYDEILPLCTLHKLVSYMLEFTGNLQFSITDIIEPKPKRTRKILHFLIQLWTDIVKKGHMYTEMAERQQEEMDRKQQILDKINAVKSRIRETDAEIEQLQQVKPLSEKYKKVLEEKMKAKEIVAEEYQKVKHKQAEFNKVLMDLDVKYQSQKERYDELDQKILKSPSRLDAEMKQLEQSKAEVDVKIKEQHVKVLEQKKLINSINDVNELLIKTNESIGNIRSSCDEFREASTSILSNLAELNELKKNDKRMVSELENAEKQKYQCEEWSVKENLNGKKRLAANKEITEMNKQGIEKVHAAIERSQAAADDLQKQVNLSEKTLSKEQNIHEEYTKKVKEEYDLLTKSLVDYIEMLGNQLDSATREAMEHPFFDKLRKKDKLG